MVRLFMLEHPEGTVLTTDEGAPETKMTSHERKTHVLAIPAVKLILRFVIVGQPSLVASIVGIPAGRTVIKTGLVALAREFAPALARISCTTKA